MGLDHCMHCVFHVALHDCVLCDYIHGDMYIEFLMLCELYTW